MNYADDVDASNYDDYNEFYSDLEADNENNYDDVAIDESMDGDHDSAMESAGWGLDEQYGPASNEDYEEW